jgi:hypothetical protein
MQIRFGIYGSSIGFCLQPRLRGLPAGVLDRRFGAGGFVPLNLLARFSMLAIRSL